MKQVTQSEIAIMRIDRTIKELMLTRDCLASTIPSAKKKSQPVKLLTLKELGIV